MRSTALIVLILVSSLFLPLAAGNAAPAGFSRDAGKKLMERYGCNHCHIVAGSGGTVAPPLDGIADYCSKEQIVARLVKKVHPSGLQGVIPDSLMNHVHVAPRDAQLIADYVLTLKKNDRLQRGHGRLTDQATVDQESLPQGTQFVPLPKSASTEKGGRLYWMMGCIACHSIGPVGGQIGPNLAGIGARRSKQFIQNRILSGATVLPEPGKSSKEFAMPPQEICPEHAQKLTEFLLTLPPEASLYSPQP